ncbi:MAG TPA: O-methyltransferase [Flavitalea sp.]|nr:O-methyltransferase [Flavitalea sp.]
MDIINPLAQVYAEKFSGTEDPVLKEIARETAANREDAQMLSGHLQGKFLEMISKMLKPERILEIGTFMGYSAICLAKGLLNNGKLHTIELRQEDGVTAQANFKKANLGDQIILHVGNALTIIPTLNEPWDLVFIDADKANYVEYYKLIFPSVKPGGIILADNVLFHGQVLEEPIKGKNAKAIQAFNEYLDQDVRVEKVLLTIRDGLLMIRKNG